jgi:hypothetical protein
MDSFAVWLKGTAISGFVTHYPWVWPACETLHFIGIALLIGVTGALDLRLLGFMRAVPVVAMLDLMPWAVAAFAVNLVTGVLFFVGEPGQYVNNPAFYAKVLFIMLAGVNAVFFQVVLYRETCSVGSNEHTSALAKIVAVTSLLSWMAVMYWGRMLPFIGDAF